MTRLSRHISEKRLPAPSVAVDGIDAGSGRRARKLQQTMDHIGAAAWTLFETHGFDNVTMEAIAETADVAKGTLYKYFPIKEALIRHRFEKDRLELRDEIVAAVLAKPSCAERLALFFHIEADYLNKMRSYLGAYVRYLLRSGQTERDQGDRDAERFVAELLRQGQASGEITSDLPAETMAEHLVFMRSGTLIRWLASPDGSLPPMLEEMLRLFLGGALRKLPP
jgi:AcrR family transcriptional regulator